MTSPTLRMAYHCPLKNSDLQSTSDGKFCGRCAKHIPDMRSATKEEIIKKIDEGNGEFCGTFNPLTVENPFGDKRDKIVHWYQGKQNSRSSRLGVWLILGLFLIVLTGCWTRRRGYVSYQPRHVNRFPTTMNQSK